MSNLKIEINFDDIVQGLFETANVDCEEFGSQAYPTRDLQDEVKDNIVSCITMESVKLITDAAKNEVTELAKGKVIDFVEKELGKIIQKKLQVGNLPGRWNGFKSFDELIERKMDSDLLEREIKRHIDKKSKDFAREFKERYDNVFAAKIVSSLAENKMLNPEVAKILLSEK